jgi:hypothetical protein
MEESAPAAMRSGRASVPGWIPAGSATFAFGTFLGLALSASAVFLDASGVIVLALGTAGPLLALFAGGVLQARSGHPAAWSWRVVGWALGCVSLGLWVVVPPIALTGAIVWFAACLAAATTLFALPERRVAAAVTLAALAADAALFVLFYNRMMLQTDFALEPFVAPNASAFALLWTLALLRGRSGKLLL